MFSYFKAHHRRAGSTPSSPRTPQWQDIAPDPQADMLDIQTGNSGRPGASPSPQASSRSSPVSPFPPTLPPIPRVSSQHESFHRTHQFSKSDLGPVVESSIGISTDDSAPLLSPRPKTSVRRPTDQNALKINTGVAIAASGRVWEAVPQIQFGVGDSQPRGGMVQTGYRHPAMSQYNPKLADNHAYTLPEGHCANPSTTPSASQSPNGHLRPSTDVSRRPSTPSSSMSSFQKSGISSNTAPDTSPGSFKANTQAPMLAPPRQPKGKMGYLNPVSLLRRRRTAQESIAEGGSFSHHKAPVMQLPDDYDPRIKGTRVHDFNAPRPRRNYSTNDVRRTGSLMVGDASPIDEYRRRSSNFGRQLGPTGGQNVWVPHKPALVQGFEELNDEAPRDDIRRDSLADSSYLSRMSKHMDVAPAELDLYPTSSGHVHRPSAQGGGASAGGSTGEALSERQSSEQGTVRSSPSLETTATSPPVSPPKGVTSASSHFDPSYFPAGLSKHRLTSTTSRGSRFSFQLNSDQTIAQEKAMEDMAKDRRPDAASAQDDQNYDFDDEGMFDDFDDEGPYEEPIPMTNVDEADMDHYLSPKLQASQDSAWSGGPSPQPSAGKYAPGEQAKELPGYTQDEDFASSLVAFASSAFDNMYYTDESADMMPSWAEHGRDIEDSEAPMKDVGTSDGQRGDAPAPSTMWTPHGVSATAAAVEGGASSIDAHVPGPAPGVTQLSSQNLNAWHDALASAATQAEAAGKFRRQPSAATSMSGSDLGWYGQLPAWSQEFSRNTVDADDFAGFDYLDEEGLDEDPMIAEANAEILASDDADFYGHEFGFYSAPKSRGGQAVNGGYFVSAEELNRSMTARNACQEPNLTPITERSEFSGRNSFISLHRLGSSYSIAGSGMPRNDGLPSPGLRELRATLAAEDMDRMSLSQLRQLRKTAFGSSSAVTSPHSSNPSPSVYGPQMFPRYTDESPSSAVMMEDNEGGMDYRNVLQGDSGSPRLSLSSAPTAAASASLAFGANAKHDVASLASNSPSPANSSSAAGSSITTHARGNGLLNEAAPVPDEAASSSSFSPPVQPPSPTYLPTETVVPPISAGQIHKFAARPPASSLLYAERERERIVKASPGEGGGDSLSVAYVLENGAWYLERRRRVSGGGLVVVGREPVEAGSI